VTSTRPRDPAGASASSTGLALHDGAALLGWPMWQWLLPIGGAMAVVCSADLLVGQDTYLASLMSVVPPLAALLLFPLEVVVSSGLGLLLMIGLTHYDGLGDAEARRLFEGTLVAYATRVPSRRCSSPTFGSSGPGTWWPSGRSPRRRSWPCCHRRSRASVPSGWPRATSRPSISRRSAAICTPYWTPRTACER
jgi:hypothetical protein